MRPLSSEDASSRLMATRTRESPLAWAAMTKMLCRSILAWPGKISHTCLTGFVSGKNGLAPGTATDTIMAPVARALSESQIEDVAAYYASRVRPSGKPR